MVRDRREERTLLVGERRVPVADELADLSALPAERDPDRKRARAALRPGDAAVLEHERGSGRTDGVNRGPDDRLQGLLEIERLRDGFGDLRERLELADSQLGIAVELGVLDRLSDLSGRWDEQVDLASELARSTGTCAAARFSGPDSGGEDRLVGSREVAKP